MNPHLLFVPIYLKMKVGTQTQCAPHLLAISGMHVANWLARVNTHMAAFYLRKRKNIF